MHLLPQEKLSHVNGDFILTTLYCFENYKIPPQLREQFKSQI